MSVTHEHAEECEALYREWSRYDAVASDTSGRIDANTRGNARRERDMFARQLRAMGCSREAPPSRGVARDE